MIKNWDKFLNMYFNHKNEQLPQWVNEKVFIIVSHQGCAHQSRRDQFIARIAP